MNRSVTDFQCVFVFLPDSGGRQLLLVELEGYLTYLTPPRSDVRQQTALLNSVT